MTIKFNRLLVCFLSCLLPLVAEALPVSDLATEEFDKGPSALAPGTRNPFIPALGKEVDIRSLHVQGLIIGGKLRMALLSGRIIREGDSLGNYLVKEVKEDHVTLASGDQLYNLPVENYLPASPGSSESGYLVEFNESGIRESLTMLAKAAGVNLMLPNDLSGAVSVSFRNANLLETLYSILQANGFSYKNNNGIYLMGKPDDFVGGSDLKTRIFKLEYAPAKDLADRVKKIMSDKGNAIADERSNVLTVRDYEPVVADIEKLVAMVDKRDLQVHIEGRIIDATETFARALGIQWGISDSTGTFRASGTTEVGTNSNSSNPFNVNLGAATPTSGISMILGRFASGLQVENKLSAAEQHGDIRVISRPSITTVNNVPAKIRSGAKIYVKSTSSISVGTSSATSSTSQSGLQEIDTGVELTVTPQISSDNMIRLQIIAKESEPDFSKTVDGIPSVLDNSADTMVLLVDEETVVIGGLYKVTDNRARGSVPGISRVPVLGNLFKNKSKTKENRELLIFITPKLIKM